MCGSMVDIQSAAAEIRRGIKKKIEDRKKSQGKNIVSASATQAGHNQDLVRRLMAESWTIRSEQNSPESLVSLG